MKPIAAPIIGGMVTSTIHVLDHDAGHLLHHEAAGAPPRHPQTSRMSSIEA